MGSRATGGFSGFLATLTHLFSPGKVFIGRASYHGIGLLQPVGLSVKRHLMLYAMTGSSKTTSIITMIATWRGAVFLVDPKGQVVFALAEQDWRTWHVIAPGEKNSACINFFDVIKEMMKRYGRDAAVRWSLRLAEALIITAAGAKNPYFTDVARQFLAALILHVLTKHPEQDHNLPFVRDLIINGYLVFDDFKNLISTPEEAQTLLFRAMLENDAFEIIAGGAQALISASGETAGNVRSVLQEQTKWLDMPDARAVLRHSTISLSDLKTRDDTVVALAASIFSVREGFAAFVRALTNFTAYTFEAVPERKGLCLAVLDELPSAGYNAAIEVSLAVLRSMGMVVVAISQSIELMRKTYPKSYKSFSGEADATIWAGGNHQENVEHLSQLLGRRSIVEKDPYSGRKHYRDVDVMTPDQLRRFLHPDSGNIIVTRAGDRPLKLKAPYYFKELAVWQYAADPDHREALLRRFSRLFFRPKRRSANDRTPAPIQRQERSSDAHFEMPMAVDNTVFETPNHEEMTDEEKPQTD